MNIKQLAKDFLVGTLSLIPLFVVVQILLWIYSMGITIFNDLFIITNDNYVSFGVIIFIILFLTLIGSSIEKAGKSFLINFIDEILQKLPAIGIVYTIIKKITELFKPNAKSQKREVVLVEYPKAGLWVPAYVLNKHEDIWVLFVPTSPNPTSGYAIIADKNITKPTTLTISEASQFIVSMGADFIKKEEISVIIKEANIVNS
jgi:uncharacterized membrane protein